MVMEARKRTRLVTGLLVLVGLPLLAVAVLRTIGWDGSGWYLTALLALTPYFVVYGVLLAALALMLRRWWIGCVVLALSVLLAVYVAPRVIPDAQPAAHGKTVRVLAANLYLGQADPAALVRLVREHRIDVLNLVEMTPAAMSGLEKAGLFQTLPYRVMHPASGVDGSGIVSRYPLTEEDFTGDSVQKQPGAEADLGGGTTLEIVAAHPRSPDSGYYQWEQEMRDLSRAIGEHGLRVVAGDFNATLDHAALRTVLSRGYVDAAEARGDGMVPTWSTATVPLVPLDHVLVDRRVAIRDYQAFEVPGSDHRAVYAEVQLP
ncbi:endonuclease/exonuclease/phosphatase family protein [Amycolatopsis sp. NPDC004079]|uniref:endonuclease/exonuclease/phosphatase family protein n=1 Tax=Amycolatopsis sp. NPDC004079 TaxID=3154549 RepID=UPI0033A59A94